MGGNCECAVYTGFKAVPNCVIVKRDTDALSLKFFYFFTNVSLADDF